MRLIDGRWLVGLAAATGLMVSVSGHAVLAAQSAAPVEISSFSGAYLAARVAEVDNDLEGAIAYYKKALSFDPERLEIRGPMSGGKIRIALEGEPFAAVTTVNVDFPGRLNVALSIKKQLGPSILNSLM